MDAETRCARVLEVSQSRLEFVTTIGGRSGRSPSPLRRSWQGEDTRRRVRPCSSTSSSVSRRVTCQLAWVRSESAELQWCQRLVVMPLRGRRPTHSIAILLALSPPIILSMFVLFQHAPASSPRRLCCSVCSLPHQLHSPPPPIRCSPPPHHRSRWPPHSHLRWGCRGTDQRR